MIEGRYSVTGPLPDIPLNYEETLRKPFGKYIIQSYVSKLLNSLDISMGPYSTRAIKVFSFLGLTLWVFSLAFYLITIGIKIQYEVYLLTNIALAGIFAAAGVIAVGFALVRYIPWEVALALLYTAPLLLCGWSSYNSAALIVFSFLLSAPIFLWQLYLMRVEELRLSLGR